MPLDRLLAACTALGPPLPAPRLLRPTRLPQRGATLLPVALVGAPRRTHAIEVVTNARAALAPGDPNGPVLERVASALSSGAIADWVQAAVAVTSAHARGPSPVGARLLERLLEETVCLLPRAPGSLELFLRRDLPNVSRLASSGVLSRLCLYGPATPPGPPCWHEQILMLRSPFTMRRASPAPTVPEVRADGELAKWLGAPGGTFVMPRYRAATHVWSRLCDAAAGQRRTVELRAAADGAERTIVDLHGAADADGTALATLEAFLLDGPRDLSTLPRRMRCGSGAMLDATSATPKLLAMTAAMPPAVTAGGGETPEVEWIGADIVAERLRAAVGAPAAERLMRDDPYETPGDLASRVHAIRAASGPRPATPR